MDVPSRSQVKKAGSNLRKYLRGDLADEDVYLAALDTMERYRRAHSYPLVIANNGLRARARSLGIQAEVTQRLKRSQTILEKLRREPTLDLSRMQDIGGCRAVVENKDDLRRWRSGSSEGSRRSPIPITSSTLATPATAACTSW